MRQESEGGGARFQSFFAVLLVALEGGLLGIASGMMCSWSISMFRMGGACDAFEVLAESDVVIDRERMEKEVP